MKSMTVAVEQSMSTQIPQAEAPLVQALYSDLGEGMDGITPQLVDVAVRVNASVLTEKELRDLLAFEASDSGRSIAQKRPIIAQQTAQQTVPIVMTLMPQLMQKTLDRACAEQHCTASQRQAMADAMAKALHRHPS